MTFRSVNSAMIERQIVLLALAVLNEKVAAALKCSSGQAIATAEVITLFVLFLRSVTLLQSMKVFVLMTSTGIQLKCQMIKG